MHITKISFQRQINEFKENGCGNYWRTLYNSAHTSFEHWLNLSAFDTRYNKRLTNIVEPYQSLSRTGYVYAPLYAAIFDVYVFVAKYIWRCHLKGAQLEFFNQSDYIFCCSSPVALLHCCTTPIQTSYMALTSQPALPCSNGCRNFLLYCSRSFRLLLSWP